MATVAPIDTELRARADRLAVSDPVGGARALVELGVYTELSLGDRKTARKHYEAARSRAASLEPPLARIRRTLEGRMDLPYVLKLLDEELAMASSSARRADLLAERGRVLESAGKADAAREAYLEARALDPAHAASVRALELLYRRELARGHDPVVAAALAEHLGEVAAEIVREGPAVDPVLPAWILAEQAALLDGLGRVDEARAALVRAAELAPGPGVVRDALVAHLVRHGEWTRLAGSLQDEAGHETDAHRAARLLFVAARLVAVRESRNVEALGLLERCLALAPEDALVGRLALDETVRLAEELGDRAAIMRARARRLPTLSVAAAASAERLRLAELAEADGDVAGAASYLQEALEQSPDDPVLAARLDHVLAEDADSDGRVRLHLRLSAAPLPTERRVEARMAAARVAHDLLGSSVEAIAHLRAAWAIDPGNPDVFEALSSLVAPPARDLEEDQRGALARLELFTEAARVEPDVARKVALLERAAMLWEDELGHPGRAADVLESVLALDPERRTALVSLARCAARAGDPVRLAHALEREAELSKDATTRRRLLLRAADVHATRLGDPTRALALLDRAQTPGARDPRVLRARVRVARLAQRDEDARVALTELAQLSTGRDAFDAHLELARLHEHARRRPDDAIAAYRAAARALPDHPLPKQEIARLVRQTAAPRPLAEALSEMAAASSDTATRACLLVEAALVEALALDDDVAARASLERARTAVDDPLVRELVELLLRRKGDRAELAQHYRGAMGDEVASSPRVALALAVVLSESSRSGAVEVLESVLGRDPRSSPAILLLSRLHRESGAAGPLPLALRIEADELTSRLARRAALWELARLEDQLGASATFDALSRLVAESRADSSALDAQLRLGLSLPEAQRIDSAVALADGRRARANLEPEPHARAVLLLEEALLREAVGDERSALACFREALALSPESLLSARGVARLAPDDGGDAFVDGQLGLARVLEAKDVRAGHLEAAALALGGREDGRARAIALHEQALALDPSSSSSHALLPLLADDPVRLAAILGDALERATDPKATVALGTAVGSVVLVSVESGADVPSVLTGIAAARRAAAVAPDDPDVRLLLARLLSAAELWAEARDAFRAVAERASGPTRTEALFELCSLLRDPLGDLVGARNALVTILGSQPEHRVALEELLSVAREMHDTALTVDTLRRLATCAPDGATRVEHDLALAEACREAGDPSGIVAALADAIATIPEDGRAFALLAAQFRVETPGGGAAYAAALEQVITTATTRGLPISPTWLVTLGLLESRVLLAHERALSHLTRAVALPGAPLATRLALARVLEAANRNAEAVATLRETLLADEAGTLGGPDLAQALVAMEAALAKEGRLEERAMVEEVRTCLGETGPDRVGHFRARLLPAQALPPACLGPQELPRLLVPASRGAHVPALLALAPVVAKVLRFDVGGLGLASRDKLGPRDGHATRALADRLARALGVESFDLYLSSRWTGPLRAYPGDPPLLVGPRAIADLPEAEQVFALAHALARVALGVPFLDDLPPSALDGLALAAVRAVSPAAFPGLSSAREAASSAQLAAVTKALGRKQRRALEDLAPVAVAPADAAAFATGLAKSALRLAHLLSGGVLPAMDHLRRVDPILSRAGDDPRALTAHPVAGELLRWALSAEAAAERRRVGTSAT